MYNDIISQPAVAPQELNQGGTSTAEAVFVTGTTNPNTNATQTSVPVFLPLPSDGKLASTNAGSWAANGSGGPKVSGRFKVIAWGRGRSVAAGNITVKLYYTTSKTATTVPASGNALASTGAVSVTGYTNWMIECTMVWDAISQKINGQYNTQLAATVVAPTTITNVITAAVPDTGVTQGFVITGTFGTGVATNELKLDMFCLALD